MPGSTAQEFWCVCRKYCKGRRRQLNTANTRRRHLREADEDEKDAIRLAGFPDAFRAFMNAASKSQLDHNVNQNLQHSGPPVLGTKRPADNDRNSRSPSRQRPRRVRLGFEDPTITDNITISTINEAPSGPSADLPALESSTQVTVTTSSNKLKAAWCPPANKSGRTLCSHRWLRQVKPNGSHEEFNAYYKSLASETKARYKDEAAKLVAGGLWTKGTADIIAKIDVLPMH